MTKTTHVFKYFNAFILICLLIISACGSDAETSQKTNTVKQNKKQQVPSPYWSAARKEIPLSEKDERDIKSIQNKYKKEINQLKKQKKWNANEQTRIERQRSEEERNALGDELYSKYKTFNKTWQQKKSISQSKPSPYWTQIRKDLRLNETQESDIKSIQNKYKKEINQLKKQKKWNANERTRIEGERAKEIKNKLGSELYSKYDTFNKNWAKKKAEPKVGPYWGEIKKAIPLSDKEIAKVKSIQNKYKKEINQLKKQKKWNANERTRIEGERSEEMKKLLGKKYDKYEKFNADWRKKKK